MNTNPRTRPNKGSSLLMFPEDYTVIDIETTGYDPRWNEIIELAALRIRGGEVAERYVTLVRPSHDIDSFIEDLTGITNRDLLTAPFIGEALPVYLDFIGSDVVVGHNAHFDVNFIYDAAERFCRRTFRNDIVDTMRLARHILPELSSHTLSDVAQALGVVRQGEHRALVDCETTYAVMQALKDKGFVFHADSGGNRIHYAAKAADITAVDGLAQPDNPLYGKVCVFTGALSITRKDAMQAVANIGGICADSVTKKTNYLILGNNDYCMSIRDGKSSKQKRAEELILKGQDLQILSESVFFEYIDQIGITD